MNFIESVWNKAKQSNKTIVLPEGDDPRVQNAGEIIIQSRIAKVISLSGAGALTRGIELVQSGKADGLVAGATHYTSEVIKTCLKEVGLAQGQTRLTSFFIMIFPDQSLGENGLFFFADCAVMPCPSKEQRGEIAAQTAASFLTLTGKEPRVALLDEVDIGTALSTSNILIFPNLNAGNIGYKIAERLGGATAIGPILQGAAKPVNDLSRGCSVEDIVNVAAITAVQSGAANA